MAVYPLVSVLMVNYNREQTLRAAIESILNQTYRNLQIIIVDDGSTDQSCRVIEEYPDSRIELYKREKNRQICTVLNYGLKKVRGQYLARMDSDDVWAPDKLEKQIRFLQENPKYRICFTGVRIIDSQGREWKNSPLDRVFETRCVGQEEYLEHFFFSGNFLSHPSVVMETSLMREIGEYNLAYVQSQDYDYWIRVAKRYPIYVIREKLISMRRFAEDDVLQNISNSKHSSLVRFLNECMEIRKHFFDGMDDALFCSTFAHYFRNPDSHTEEELECEKAFLLCRPFLEIDTVPIAGIQKFFELFQKEEYVALLEEKFDFTVKDLYELTKTPIFIDRIYKDQMKEQLLQYKNRIVALEEESNRMKQQIASQDLTINEYENSKSWKITKPLRIFIRAFKKK